MGTQNFVPAEEMLQRKRKDDNARPPFQVNARRLSGLLVWRLKTSFHESKVPTAGPSTPFGAKTRQTALRMTEDFVSELLGQDTC